MLELHGWGELQPVANQLTREGRWQEMGALITDDILHTFAVVSEDIEQVPALLKQRYGGTRRHLDVYRRDRGYRSAETIGSGGAGGLSTAADLESGDGLESVPKRIGRGPE